jgi:hypothetical protein
MDASWQPDKSHFSSGFILGNVLAAANGIKPKTLPVGSAASPETSSFETRIGLRTFWMTH